MPNIAAPQLVCVRGETRTYTLTHQTSETSTTPINITGWTIAARVSREADSGTVLVSLTGTVTNGAAGTYTLAFTHANTLLDPGPYVLDIYRTDSGSEAQMALGTFTVGPSAVY